MKWLTLKTLVDNNIKKVNAMLQKQQQHQQLLTPRMNNDLGSEIEMLLFVGGEYSLGGSQQQQPALDTSTQTGSSATPPEDS